MHIAYLQQELILPGVRGNGRCWDMATQWTQAGHHVSFVTSSAGIPAKHGDGSFQLAGIDVHPVKVKFHHKMRFSRRLLAFWNFVRKAKKTAWSLTDVDLYLAYTAPLSVGFLGRDLSIKTGIPFVLEAADVWPDVPIGMRVIKNPLLIRYLRARTDVVYRDAARILTYSEGMRDQIVSHDVDPKKVHVWHNGVNSSPSTRVVRDKRAGKNSPERPVRVIYTGTLGKANGVEAFVRAVHWLETNGHRNVQCSILGDGKEEQAVRDEAKRLKVRSLEFLPPVGHEAVAEFLGTADIGVVTVSEYPVLEANGSTKSFDYLAAGVPLVINYRGWLADYLAKYQCGLSCDQGDQVGFARNIAKLIEEPGLRDTMGENGRRLAETHFDRKLLAERALRWFDSIVGG